MLTAFLSRADVSRHMQALHLLRALREAMSAPAPTAVHQFEAHSAGLTTHVRHASWPSVPAFSVTARTGPRSVLQLHDAKSGKVMAVMNAGHLTALRASLVGALAADVLARDDARQVAVLGSGAAASSALKALRLVRSIQRVWLYEEDPAANTELALRLQSTLATSVRGTNSPEEAVENADLIVLAGEVALPSDVVRPGAHVTVLNADAYPSSPLPASLLRRARRFTDATTPGLEWGAPFATLLGDVLSNQQVGRQSPDDVTVFASVGPAFLDLIAAWHVFEGAREDEALVRFDLES
jgi:ornithine cyclodeaminase